MAINSVSDFSSFINCQIQFQERLGECLGQLEALMTIAVTVNDFYDAPKNILPMLREKPRHSWRGWIAWTPKVS